MPPKNTLKFTSNYLVGGLEHFLFFHVLGIIIIPTVTHSIIFQRGRWLNHQPARVSLWLCWRISIDLYGFRIPNQHPDISLRMTGKQPEKLQLAYLGTLVKPLVKRGQRTVVGWLMISLWLCQNSCWKWPFIVDFPIKIVIFHSYVKLPEGMTYYSMSIFCWLGRVSIL